MMTAFQTATGDICRGQLPMRVRACRTSLEWRWRGHHTDRLNCGCRNSGPARASVRRKNSGNGLHTKLELGSCPSTTMPI